MSLPNRSLLIFFAAIFALLTCAIVLSIILLPAPVLVLTIDGKPASNAKIALPLVNGKSLQFDQTGRLESQELVGQAILISKPKGGAISVQFPKYGTKKVEIEGETIITTTHGYWGWGRERIEQRPLTKEEFKRLSGNQE